MKPRYLRREHHHVVPGLVLVGLGVILLLDRLAIVPIAATLRFWPVVLVAFGTVLLVETASAVARTAGGVVLAAGLLLQAGNLGYFHLHGDVFWPLALIGAGIVLMARILEERNRPEPEAPSTFPPAEDPFQGAASYSEFKYGTRPRPQAPPEPPPFQEQWKPAVENQASVFGHVERRVNDQSLEKLNIAAVFGSFNLDLRAAGIKGEVAEIEAAAVFGGIQIVVPEDWKVIPQGAGIFGGFSDETRHTSSGPLKRLVVKGAAVFGGIVISNEEHDWRRRQRETHDAWRAQQRQAHEAWREARRAWRQQRCQAKEAWREMRRTWR